MSSAPFTTMSSASEPATTPSLQRNVAWALAGNLGYSACQWGVLVCIAKLGTAADVGRFALGLALTAPVITLISLNLRLLQSTDARSDYPFSVYLSVRLIGTVLGLAAIAVLALALGYRGDLLYLILVVGFAKAFEAVSDVIFGLLQKAENLRRVAISMLLKGVISVLAVGVLLRLTGDLVLATLAMALCWGSLLATYDLPAAVRIESLRPTLEPRALARLAWVALPLGCVAGISSLAFNVPRYFIEDGLGATALGHFTALSYLFVAATQPVLALGMAVNPRLGRHFVTDLGAYRRLTWRTMLIAGGMGLLGIAACALFGPSMLTLVYSPEYATQEVVLIWLAAATGVGFLGQALSYAVTAARRLPEQLPIALLSLAVCTVGSYLLVPRYGLVGAAWAVLATEATKLACLGAVYAGAVAGASPAARPLRGRRRGLRVPGHAVEGDLLPLSVRASLTARAAHRKPLIVEIAGCSGSGKSTLMKEILRQCAERGLPVTTAEEVALPRLPHAIRRHPTLQNLALDLRGLRETITLRRDREFLAFAMSMIRRDTDRAFTALSACRGVLRKLAIHSLLAREGNGWHAVLVDEGTIHSAHYVLAHVNHAPRREDVEVFCRLVPMPDLVVHVAARLETVLARTFVRRDPPLRWRTKEEMERFIRHAHKMFDLLMSQDSLSRKTLRVQCDEDGLGAYRTFAKEIVDRIVDGSASAPGIACAV
jgi:O-antigen/teichoic acid export membrane protein